MMMTQQKEIIRHGLVLAAWLLLWGGLLVPAHAYREATLPSAWDRTPVMSEDVRPHYEFRSTSVYTAGGERSYTGTVGSAFSSKPRRSTIDEEDDPEGPEIGQVDTPVGEPLVLLVLALAYGLIMGSRRSHRRSTGSPMTLK